MIAGTGGNITGTTSITTNSLVTNSLIINGYELFSNNDINASQLSTMQTDPEVVKLIENLKGL